MDAKTGRSPRPRAISLTSFGTVESDTYWGFLGFACVINASQTSDAPTCWGYPIGEFWWAEDTQGGSGTSPEWLQHD